MAQFRSADSSAPALFATIAALAVAAAASSGVALAHIWTTSQRGAICGDGAAHCWACYAAPMLALAALTLWGAVQRRQVRVLAVAPRNP